MKIGNIEFGERPLFLAPMEDVTDIGFRMLCKRFGAAMVYTEFVSAEALIRDVNSTVRKLTISDVTSLISNLLNNNTPGNAADINGDGKVTISDVTYIINLLLSTN